jgi:hypothetical protein
MSGPKAEVDLTLHVDPTPAGSATLEADITAKIAGIELEAELQIGPDGKPVDLTIGVKIPIP